MPSTISTPARPLSLLEAVNELLAAVGRDAVMSLDSVDSTVEARQALEAISTVAREIQQAGWFFNTEEDYPLAPDSAGYVYLPPSTGAVMASPRSQHLRLVQRGNKLYSKTQRSDTFDETVWVELVLIFPFEDIPPPIRWYIVAQAGRRYGTNRVPDMNAYRFSSKVETDAYLEAIQHDTESRGETSPQFSHMRRGQRGAPVAKPVPYTREPVVTPVGGQIITIIVDGGEEG